MKKAQLINDIADTISHIPDPVKRSTYVEDTASKFGVENSILFDRIQNQRRSAKTETTGEKPVAEPTQATATLEENKILAPVEKDILSFLLRNGRDVLEFESDSDFYGGEDVPKPTVADFIRDALDCDGTKMANTVYAAVYDAYCALYDDGLGQADIVKRLLDSDDRRVAEVVGELSIEKYMLSVEDLKAALTTESSWLVTQVPKVILCYAESRIRDRIDTLKRKLVSDVPSDEQMSAMQEIVKLQAAQKKIKTRIGREKTE